MKRTADRRRNRYIESEKGQTRMYRAREVPEVHDWALPNRSRETEETSGVLDLTQKEKVE